MEAGERWSKNGETANQGRGTVMELGDGDRLCLETGTSHPRAGGDTRRGASHLGTALAEALSGGAEVPVLLHKSSGNLDIRRLLCLQYPIAFHTLCPSHFFSYQFLDAKKSWVVQVDFRAK